MFSIYRRYRNWKSRNKKTAKDKSRAYARRLKRDVKQCEKKGCKETRHLEVHHIDEDAFNNKMSNLIKLCLPHHLGRHKHQKVASLMRKKLAKLGKKIQTEVDRGPFINFILRLYNKCK